MSDCEPFGCYVFLYDTLNMGGIETLIVRLANDLVKSRQRVVICYRQQGPLIDNLDPAVTLVQFRYSGEAIHLLKRLAVPLPATVALITFDPISAARGLAVQLALGRQLRVRHVSGIFHPRAYFMTGERRDRAILNKMVAKAVGWSSLFFMNAESRNSHQVRWQENLDASAIIILPADEAVGSWTASDSSDLRILSIGRLVDFKGYNLGAPTIVNRCVAEGIQLTWDIYGTGPLQGAIENEIVAQSVEGRVRLLGMLPYGKLRATVHQYDIFIGVGTAALEAAMEGVPTLCATDTEPLLCYGYFHELPLGNLGELQETPPPNSFVQKLIDYSKFGKAAKTRLSQLGRDRALEYSTPNFHNSLLKALMVPDDGNYIYRLIVSALYRSATEGIAVRAWRLMRSSLRRPRQFVR